MTENFPLLRASFPDHVEDRQLEGDIGRTLEALSVDRFSYRTFAPSQPPSVPIEPADLAREAPDHVGIERAARSTVLTQAVEPGPTSSPFSYKNSDGRADEGSGQEHGGRLSPELKPFSIRRDIPMPSLVNDRQLTLNEVFSIIDRGGSVKPARPRTLRDTFAPRPL